LLPHGESERKLIHEKNEQTLTFKKMLVLKLGVQHGSENAVSKANSIFRGK
jgi:hypothetical protein